MRDAIGDADPRSRRFLGPPPPHLTPPHRRWPCPCPVFRVVAVALVLNVGPLSVLLFALCVFCLFSVGWSAWAYVPWGGAVGSSLVLVVVVCVSRWLLSLCVCGGFLSVVPGRGASRRSNRAENWEIRLVRIPFLNSPRVRQPCKSAGRSVGALANRRALAVRAP